MIVPATMISQIICKQIYYCEFSIGLHDLTGELTVFPHQVLLNQGPLMGFSQNYKVRATDVQKVKLKTREKVMSSLPVYVAKLL
jgi:hypothetical protein